MSTRCGERLAATFLIDTQSMDPAIDPQSFVTDFDAALHEDQMYFAASGMAFGQLRTFFQRNRMSPTNRNNSVSISTRAPDEDPYAARMSFADILAALEPQGEFLKRTGWFWLTNVFGRWEHDFRPKVAKALGVELEKVRSDVMGDIRRIRNDVVHNRGIASNEHSAKVRLLTDWVTVGDEIRVGEAQVIDLRKRFSFRLDEDA